MPKDYFSKRISKIKDDKENMYFIRIIYIILLSPLIIFSTSGLVYAVHITEVYYDPINTETGGEFIEIYNPSEESVNITGMIIKTKSSESDAIVPSFVMAPDSYYLIADSGFSTSKDNTSWPDSDLEDAITLTNTDGWVSLVLGGQILDTVGWGSSLVYEASPAELVKGGMSLSRKDLKVDTDDNLNDFIAKLPTPKNSIKLEGITLQIEVIDVRPVIESITLRDDDNTTQGIQIIPFPGQKNLIHIEVVAKNATSVKAIKGMEPYELNFTGSKYEGYLEMDFFEEPKDYTIGIVAKNSYNVSSSKDITFSYMPVKAIMIDSSDIVIGLIQDSSKDFLGDRDMSTKDRITIRNIGNTEVDIEVSGVEGDYPLGLIEYSFSEDLNSTISLSQKQIVDSNMKADTLLPLSLRVSATQVEKGSYMSRISVVAR